MPSESFLEQAERHVVEGEMRVSEQRMRLSKLEEHGRGSSTAKGLVAVLERTLAAMYADLEVARRSDSQ